MKDIYTSSADALRGALRHAVQRGGQSSLAVFHHGIGSDNALRGFDGTAQAGRIRARLDLLTPVQQALIVVSYAPRTVTCNCRARCWAGHYANPEESASLSLLLAHTAPLLTGHSRNSRLRSVLVANQLTHTAETQINLAQRCSVHRQTVAEHTAILSAALVGTRQKTGEFDTAFARIDTLLRNAGIVSDETAKPTKHEQDAAGAC
jgi:hypothetical protein